jgi:hypothetical protein
MSDITPDDSTDLAEVTRGLRVNVSGNVKLMPAAQDTPVTVYMLAGVDYPYMVNRVYSTLIRTMTSDGRLGIERCWASMRRSVGTVSAGAFDHLVSNRQAKITAGDRITAVVDSGPNARLVGLTRQVY